jgi:hypothetical protein
VRWQSIGEGDARCQLGRRGDEGEYLCIESFF